MSGAGGAGGGLPYGPQTLLVRRFLQRFAALGPDEWAAAAARGAAAEGTAAWARAERALEVLVERAGREAERDAALGPLLQLVRLPAGAGSGSGDAGGTPDAEPALAPVAPTAAAAVLALVARDLLPEGAFAVLYAPFEPTIPAAVLEPATGRPTAGG